MRWTPRPSSFVAACTAALAALACNNVRAPLDDASDETATTTTTGESSDTDSGSGATGDSSDTDSSSGATTDSSETDSGPDSSDDGVGDTGSCWPEQEDFPAPFTLTNVTEGNYDQSCTLEPPVLADGMAVLAMSCLDEDTQEFVDLAVAVVADALPTGLVGGESVDLHVETDYWTGPEPGVVVSDSDGPIIAALNAGGAGMTWAPVLLTYHDDPECEPFEYSPGWTEASVEGGTPPVVVEAGESALVGDDTHEWRVHVSAAEEFCCHGPRTTAALIRQ